MGLITVKSALPIGPDGATPVALWDVDPEHPGGEVYIAGNKAVTVAETARVLNALASRRLIEVDPSEVEEDEEAEGEPVVPPLPATGEAPTDPPTDPPAATDPAAAATPTTTAPTRAKKTGATA